MINRTLGPQSWREYIVFAYEGVKFNAEIAVARFRRKNVVTDADLRLIASRERKKHGSDVFVSADTIKEAAEAYKQLTRQPITAT